MVSEHVKDNQSLMNILLSHGSENSKFILTYRLTSRLHQQLNERLPPVLAVTHKTQIRKRFLGRSELALALAEFVAESHEQTTESAALVLRERQDTSQVVAFGGVLFLGEVADEVAAGFVACAHAVEEEGVDVVIESFVIEEELAEKT